MTSNNMERSAPKLDESYINDYQAYTKQQSGYQSFIQGTSTPSTETKIANDAYENNECKICAVIGKPNDLPRVLNQGLYYKYTSSQDFFYTKDLTSILEKKRQPASIKYYDDLAYDDDREHMKAFFSNKDSKTLMNEIKEFYSQFYLFPRNFQKPYFRILGSNIAKHRRIEYIKVFQNSMHRETVRTKNNEGEDIGFNFMHMLGETFLKDNYREISTMGGERPSERRSGIRRETEQYLKDVEANFNILKNMEKQRLDEESNKLSNALYNKQYMLYSRNDSETAEEYLRNVLQEFKAAEKNVKTKLKEVKVIKIEPEKKNNSSRDKKKIVARSRPQSPTGNLTLRKYQSEHNSILKEIMKDADNGKPEMDYLPEKVNANGQKTARDTQRGETSYRVIRPESVSNLHQNRKHSGNMQRKELRGTNLISKFTPDSIHEVIYDRESIVNQVSQMRTSQNKVANYKSEERKNHAHIETHYKPPVCEDGSSTATSKQAIKVSYVNSPSGFKSHSSLETLIKQKQEEKSSKVIRPEVVIPSVYQREPKIILKRGDSLAGFESTRSNKSKDSRGADSATSKKILKSSKSNPRSLNRPLEGQFDSRGHAEIINLKRAADDYGSYSSVKQPYFEQEIPEVVQKLVPQSKHVRSVSSGIKKLRFEIVPEWKREERLRKGSISISSNQHIQNVSATYRSVQPAGENYNSVKAREEHRNYEQQRITEIYSQATNVRRRKAKSSANILIHPSISKADASGKESRRSMEADVEASGVTEKKKITFRDIKDLVAVWSPRLLKNSSSKSPIKIQPNKVSKHYRHASRG